MYDQRIKKQAEVLVDYSLKVKKGEKIAVFADIAAKPLVLELYKLLIQKGISDVRLHYDTYEMAEIYYKYASNEQINFFPKIDLEEMKYVDCFVNIASQTNTKAMATLAADKIAKRLKTLKPISDRRVEKTRWIVTRYPTEAQAQEAEMTLSEYENFVFNAINKVDWKKMYHEQEKLRKLIDKTKTVRIVTKDTDLSLSIAGRRAENCAGEFNMPDGEVFTSVVEGSAA